jgi:1-acyl-sn-glycerol-3-phosphate acyltransferase
MPDATHSILIPELDLPRMPNADPRPLLFFPRLALAVLGFFAASAYGVGLALIRRDRSRVAYDTARMLVRLMRPPLGFRTRVVGRENLEARRPCIYLSNHQSAYDVPVLAELYPVNTVVIGKKELSRIPFFGWVFRVTGNILIDRRHNPSAVGRLKEVEEAIRERGVSVWIFPEGTRGKVPGKLLPFKKGAFYMAAAASVPIVPIVVEPLRPYFDAERHHLCAGEIEVRVLAPIEPGPSGEAGVEALMARVHNRMQEALSEMAGKKQL